MHANHATRMGATGAAFAGRGAIARAIIVALLALMLAGCLVPVPVPGPWVPLRPYHPYHHHGWH